MNFRKTLVSVLALGLISTALVGCGEDSNRAKVVGTDGESTVASDSVETTDSKTDDAVDESTSEAVNSDVSTETSENVAPANGKFKEGDNESIANYLKRISEANSKEQNMEIKQTISTESSLNDEKYKQFASDVKDGKISLADYGMTDVDSMKDFLSNISDMSVDIDMKVTEDKMYAKTGVDMAGQNYDMEMYYDLSDKVGNKVTVYTNTAGIGWIKATEEMPDNVTNWGNNSSMYIPDAEYTVKDIGNGKTEISYTVSKSQLPDGALPEAVTDPEMNSAFANIADYSVDVTVVVDSSTDLIEKISMDFKGIPSPTAAGLDAALSSKGLKYKFSDLISVDSYKFTAEIVKRGGVTIEIPSEAKEANSTPNLEDFNFDNFNFEDIPGVTGGLTSELDGSDALSEIAKANKKYQN